MMTTGEQLASAANLTVSLNCDLCHIRVNLRLISDFGIRIFVLSEVQFKL